MVIWRLPNKNSYSYCVLYVTFALHYVVPPLTTRILHLPEPLVTTHQVDYILQPQFYPRHSKANAETPQLTSQRHKLIE